MTQNTIRLHFEDNIEIALHDLKPGDLLSVSGVVVRAPVPSGHKIAAVPISSGQLVRRYGQVIGAASTDIAAGEHIHVHNLGMADLSLDYAFSSHVRPLAPANSARTFMGYKRANGRVGTRNYVGVLTSVNCSGSVARFIAEAAEKTD